MGPYELLAVIAHTLERLGVPYLVTGSVAAMAYGEPRMTIDIDVVTDLDEERIPDFLQAFPLNEYYLDAEDVRKAVQDSGQFNIIHPRSGLKVDIIIKKATPFDESRFSRRHRVSISSSQTAEFAAPEDVIIKKLEYYKQGGSDKHLRDIAGIMKISGESIDRAYISAWAERLGVSGIWAKIIQNIV